MVHIPRYVPLLRGASGGDRRQCARPRSRDALGFRLEPGTVRDLAGGGMERDCRVDNRGYRGRQKHERSARCRHGCRNWGKAPAKPSISAYRACTEHRAPMRRPTIPSGRVRRCRCIGASCFRIGCWASVRNMAQRYSRPMRCGCGIRATGGNGSADDRIAILSFKSKMHAIGSDVLDGVQQAIDEAERNWRPW